MTDESLCLYVWSLEPCQRTYGDASRWRVRQHAVLPLNSCNLDSRLGWAWLNQAVPGKVQLCVPKIEGLSYRIRACASQLAP